MTKWFDTNYHYIVPEFKRARISYRLRRSSLEKWPSSGAWNFAKSGADRSVDLSISGQRDHARSSAAWICYRICCRFIAISWPELALLAWNGYRLTSRCLALDLPEDAARSSAARISGFAMTGPGIRIAVGHLFRGCEIIIRDVYKLPSPASILIYAARPASSVVLRWYRRRKCCRWASSMGAMSGAPILDRRSRTIRRGCNAVLGASRYRIAPSCSLLHIPGRSRTGNRLDAGNQVLAGFARQKLNEISILARGAEPGDDAISEHLRMPLDAASRSARPHRRASTIRRYRSRLQRLTHGHASAKRLRRRRNCNGKRSAAPLPTTTIGSFPQTPEIRKARRLSGKGKLPLALS